MVDMMYELACLIDPEKGNERGSNKEPYWAKSFKETMMYLNLFLNIEEEELLLEKHLEKIRIWLDFKRVLKD